MAGTKICLQIVLSIGLVGNPLLLTEQQKGYKRPFLAMVAKVA